MISKDAQDTNISEIQHQNMSGCAKTIKTGLQVLVGTLATAVAITTFSDTANYLNEIMNAPPELTNVIDTRRGDVAAGVLYAGVPTAIICYMGHYARKTYGKLRSQK